MMADFKEAIDILIEHEGSKFTNIHGDPGGPTKWGITLRSAQEDNLDVDHDGDVDIDDVKGLTLEQAEDYYKRKWWLPAYDSMTQLTATKVCDTAINTGRDRAHKF